jgi:putative ABC transport system substrate-binding protein
MGIVILNRRQLLQSSLGLAGVGLLAVSGCSRLPLRTDRPPTIGYLGLGYPRNLQLLGIFIERLRELDSPRRESIVVEQRLAEPDEPLVSLASELVALKVDLIFAAGTPFIKAAKQATSTIPIVSISPDPVGTGIVSNLARPDGNITGISMLSSGLDAKRVELLRETIPGARHVDILWNPTIADKRALADAYDLRSR